ncbi:acetyl-CoA acetyltransferase [Paractinoplanes brasiliensis]|uniref:Acetyl-CoA C-acetyltransferase n=1 Tax=Paractinoplanes brasiliensis TaxID=52695 RepID=A0A4R6J7L2_9ACTN|nr:acetyl-CoA acetyltransferase [Actinoplanes brasiliensis]TDO31442.1 acetyl-CoA C-acetyltransferase [Actinoplanes brasiliensis]GID30838.1 acetyl-CoA acetyltransferase [Actinoplanes brasiliensis]
MPSPRTPVLVGVGEVSERLGEPGYRRRSPVDLAADAAREALADAGVKASTVDTVAGVPQFEISLPWATPLLGASDNYPRSVAGRLGADPRRAVLETGGGQAPQRLVNEFAAAIAAGDADVVLLFGAEAISTIGYYARRDDRPDFSESPGGSLEARGSGLDGIVSMHHVAHGLSDTPSQYSLIDNARRARLKMSRAEYASAIGRLFEPFTAVAAANPHAAAPIFRDAAALMTPTETNRPIADPYTRYVVARDKVNQGAAVVLMSAEAARRHGVREEKWVHLAGHADLNERAMAERADYGDSPAARRAAQHALEVAGIDAGELSALDLYSCYAAPVFIVAEALGVATDDPRGLTVTGGLPFFGGPGNNYSMHAIASVVRRVRAEPGGYGFVGANGGIMSKHSTGVYTTTPYGWKPSDSARIQADLDAVPAPEEAVATDGEGVVETYAVKHVRGGEREGIVLGRLDDGRRFVARSNAILDLLTEGEPIGERVSVRSTPDGNVVT